MGNGSTRARIADLYAEEARLTKQLETVRAKRRNVHAALRAFVPGYQGTRAGWRATEQAQRATVALVDLLQAGPRALGELRDALAERGVSVSSTDDPNVQRTNIWGLLRRNPLLFRRSGSRWALR